MVLSRKEQKRAFIIVAVLYGVWYTTEEWSRLLFPFIQWEASPPMTNFQLGVLNTVGNGFTLLGSFIFGHLLDTVGIKFSAVVSVFLTGVYYMGYSQSYNFFAFLLFSPLKIAGQLPQICESFVSSITDETERMRVIMRLGIPLGIAMVVGPWLGAQAVEYIELGEAQVVAGVLVISICIPLILLALPEPHVPPSRRPRMIKLGDFHELLRIPSIRKTLILRFLLDGPYQSYEALSRQYIITQYLLEATDLATLFVVVGATTVLANSVLIKWLQKYFSPQRLLQLALAALAISYILIGKANNFKHMLVLMPLQVVGVSIAYAELSAQVTKPVDKRNYGKAVGLSQASQMLAGMLFSAISGYFVDEYDFSIWCYIAGGVSVASVVLLHFIGDYMNAVSPRLPRDDTKN